MREGRAQDTITNVRETGKFVVNIMTAPIACQMSVCAENYPPHTSEFQESGLTPVPATIVRAPLVAESPVNMECRVLQIVPLPESDYTLVLGRVLLFHVDPAILGREGRVDSAALRAIGRMAGNTYVSTHDVFAMDYDAFTQIH